jgi:hypothetical protein
MHSASSGTDPTAKKKTLRNLIWGTPNSCAMSCELLHSSHTTAAIMAHSLAAVCMNCGWPAFINTTGVTHHASQRCWCYCQNTKTKLYDVDQGNILPIWRSAISWYIAAIELRAFGNACHMCIRYHSITTESYCALSSTHVTMQFTVTNNTVEKFVLLYMMRICISNTKHLRTCSVTYSLLVSKWESHCGELVCQFFFILYMLKH